MAEVRETGAENKTAELIRSQTGSDGRQGWPVCVKDRISYHEDQVGTGNVAVTFLWTMRDYIIPKLEKNNLAMAANFYTPAGLEGMVRNILGNPCIRYVILLGNEYSSQEEGKDAELTSANAIRAFFEKGVNADRKLPGFENAVYFDKNISSEAIEQVRKNVELIDLNRRMPDKPLEEKIAEANRLLNTLEKKGPFMEKPMTFEYESAEGSFPYEGGAMMVKCETIPETWVEIMHTIYRYGRDNLMDANTDRWVKEINNFVAVVRNPQNTDLSLNPFLVPMTQEKIEAYKKEMLSSELPQGKAYTYGNKLRAYLHSNAGDIKNLISSEEFKDFEFGKGPHLDVNVRYRDNICEINQIKDAIEVLKRNLYSKSVVAITWHVHEELMRKHKSSPCLVLLQFIVQDERLNVMAFFRSHDMVQGWPENAYGCAAIQREVAQAIGVEPGALTIVSGSAQIYRHYYKQVKDMLQNFRKQKENFKDPRGNFTIMLSEGRIVARLLHPENARELEAFDGKTAKEVYRKIASKCSIGAEHAMYIGAELQKAEIALFQNLPYEQDRGVRVIVKNSPKPAANRNKFLINQDKRKEIKEGIVYSRQQMKEYRRVLEQIRLDSFFV